ncbi:hypothetical protein J4206_00610 [Candidatus Woesearchaeota archaeon]|nr:hypothetical protein [Candidatus Woesearchaeota archaeon]
MAELIPKQQRQVAIICCIKDILEGEYKKEEGWLPNYVLTKSNHKVSRANIIGVVVEVDFFEPGKNSYSQIILDDGSGRISTRLFEDFDKLKGMNIGDVVVVIGRPREFGNEKYLLLEIVKKIEDRRWVDVRKLELSIVDPVQINVDKSNKYAEMREAIENSVVKEENSEEENAEKDIEITESLMTAIGKYIRENDKDEGVAVDEIISHFSSNNSVEKVEEKIQEMLKQGILFEVRPGIIKFLE